MQTLARLQRSCDLFLCTGAGMHKEPTLPQEAARESCEQSGPNLHMLLRSGVSEIFLHASLSLHTNCNNYQDVQVCNESETTVETQHMLVYVMLLHV